MNKLNVTIIIVVVLAFLVKSSLFILPEGRQAILTEFGKPVGGPITDAGVHFKKPFLEDIRLVDKRILSWDGYPNQIPTKDKKYISVDTTARWKIVDVLKFIQTVQNERGALARLDSILDANTRDVISKSNLVEAVRNTNTIIETVQRKLKEADPDETIEEEITGSLEKIKEGREALSAQIAKASDSELESFGIKIIDVQLRRISYEKSVEDKVYERMISERQRIAEKIRSIGKGEKAKIGGRLEKELQRIQSDAYRKSQEIKGAAEAESIEIYARSLGKDPDFYDFSRRLDAYKKTLTNKTHLILSNSSEFLKGFK